MRLNGFTLAEVLITLGIIGIVAAMTMPALIANSKKTEYSSKLKKFYSVMNQAILMSEQDNGEAGEWLKEGGIEGDIKDEDNNPDFGKNSDVILKFVNQYLKPYLK
ncbi:MAG: prepilin-type N-terminal cleavage/methylation domain-containing protein [Candidatus Gastranaerophilaceae bacterium]